MIAAIGDFMVVKVHACVGSADAPAEMDIIAAGVQVVVGTPESVLDMINHRALRLDHLKVLVLDETDKMLSKGSTDQIHDVFNFLPETSRCASS